MTTAKQVLDVVERLDSASSHMIAWLRRRYDPRLAGDGCDQWCYEYARKAGHYANALIDLAERGDSLAVNQQDRKLAAAGGER